MNRLGAYVGEAFEAIWRNRTRSLLTMLGMIIGTSSIIAVLGISKAASGGIAETLGSFGDAGISVSVDSNQDDPAAAALAYRDARILAKELPDEILNIDPTYQRNLTIRANGVTYNSLAASGSGFHPDSLTLREGRRLRDSDLGSGAHVCLMSTTLANRFFAGSAVGQEIRVGGSVFTVIGVYDDIKGGFFTSLGGSDFLEIPYTAFHEMMPGPVDLFQLYAKPGVSESALTRHITAVLRRLHGPAAQYTVQDNNAQIAIFQNVINIIAVGLTSVGGVALIVAGIGIMNIMLVSVTERTREIGLRKSIGANNGDIMLQFLLEAILLSLIGGGIGTVAGFLAVLGAYHAIESFVGAAPIPYLLIMSIAVGFSTLVGCVFGTYPAYRASRLDPIVALRT
ncbi:MAG: ABC transporter permease [Candidatus Velthaea sp.]